jgi:RNA polymerase sporulation-specific sigma factor
MQYDECSDEILITRLRQGEEDITDYILEKYKPLVRKCTNAMYLIGGETEDLIQEGMIGLFKAIRDYREDKDTGFYHFARLCINRQLYTAIEASNRKKHLPLNSYVSLSAGEGSEEMPLVQQQPGTQSPEQLVIERELQEEFYKRLKDQLSDMEHQVLAFYLEGNNYVQIAQMMDKTPKSIDNALQRIRQKVKQMKLE